MLLTIHNANLKKVAFIDNEKQNTLHYFDDVWTRNLETGSSTFEFTVLKKPTDSYLNEKAFVSFKYNGKSYVFNVMTVEENEQTITCYCENLNLELINEYANPYKASKAMTFVEYCNAMDLLNFTYLSIGINEISDQKRTLEWDGQDTKLARLLSLANKFDAEIDFDTQLNADSTIKSFKVNVYHENDDTHQGVGRIRNDIQLTYGKNLKSITRKIDKTNVVNAIRPTGTKDGNTVVISGLSAWEEKNKDGIVEFYQKGEMLYAPISMQLYPSTFTSNTTSDQWTRKDVTVDSDNPAVIRSTGIRELKKNAYPAITYDVDGFLDVEVGDTVKIHDDGFNPTLLVEARVADQKISFTNPDSNKTTFANFKALENRISDDMQARLNELVEQAKPYTIKLSTNNGVVFKNQEGETIVTPTLYKGGKPVVANVTWRWALDGVTTTGMTYTVRGADVSDTATLTVSAYIGNDEVATDEVSFVNVFDGADGANAYFFVAYADSPNGASGFSLADTSKRYMGHYSSNSPAQSQSYASYKWVDRANVTATFVQSVAPTNPPAGSRWKYTGSTVITANLSTINPGEQYLFIGARWVKDVITSDNLQIKDQFINGPMIKNGAVTVDKLNVGNLSAISANLGSVTAGEITLTESIPSGTYTLYEYTDSREVIKVRQDGTYVVVPKKTSLDFLGYKRTTKLLPGLFSSYGHPIYKVDPSSVSISNGRITFHTLDSKYDPASGVVLGAAFPHTATIEQIVGGLLISAGYADRIELYGSNYTSWLQLPNGVKYKIAGDLVTVDFDVTPNSSGVYIIANLKKELMPKAGKMFSRPAWTGEMARIQVETDGNVAIIGAVAGKRYNSQLSWTI